MKTSIARKGKKAIEKKNKVLEKLQIEYVSVADIKPNTYNPNRQSDHDFELLIKSMLEDGFTQPILCQKKTGEFVDGEHRWMSAIVLHHLQKNGIDVTSKNIIEARADIQKILDPSLEVPIVYVDMPMEQMKISTIRHNKARGSHDIELEAQVLRDLRELGALDWAQDSLMMDDIEMERMLDDISVTEALANPEYSNAWEPQKSHQGEVEDISSTQKNTYQGSGQIIDQAITNEGIIQQKEILKKVNAAKSEEERKQAMKEQQIYRLNLIFSDKQAEIVKKALGDKPAEKLFNMCKNELNGR